MSHRVATAFEAIMLLQDAVQLSHAGAAFMAQYGNGRLACSKMPWM